MTDIDGSDGFSCTYAKKKCYDYLNQLIAFSEYDPETAMKLADEILANVVYARRIIMQIRIEH